MFIDTHAHLQDEAFSGDADAVIARAGEKMVNLVIIPGTDLHTSRKALDMHRERTQLIPAAGYHPHDAKKADPAGLKALEELACLKEIVAVGEIGLDFHYNFSPPDVQKSVLRAQIRMAHRVRKPLILHSRESQTDLLAILKEEDAASLGGVVHCFSGTGHEAEEFLALGFCLGFTGAITYKKADEMRAVAAMTPQDRILAETDSPYLAPLPLRGKRNEPSYVPVIVEKIAEVKGMTVQQAALAIMENACRLFSLPRDCSFLSKG